MRNLKNLILGSFLLYRNLNFLLLEFIFIPKSENENISPFFRYGKILACINMKGLLELKIGRRKRQTIFFDSVQYGRKIELNWMMVLRFFRLLILSELVNLKPRETKYILGSF